MIILILIIIGILIKKFCCPSKLSLTPVPIVSENKMMNEKHPNDRQGNGSGLIIDVSRDQSNFIESKSNKTKCSNYNPFISSDNFIVHN